MACTSSKLEFLTSAKTWAPFLWEDYWLTEKVTQKLATSSWFLASLKSIRDAIIATDAHGVVIFMNPWAELYTGWKAADAAGQDLVTVAVLRAETPSPLMHHPLARPISESAEISVATYTLVSKDGRSQTVEGSLTPVLDSWGNAVNLIFVFRPVAAHPQMHELLNSIVQWAVELLEADAGDISLYDEEHDVIRYATSFGFLEQYSKVVLKPGEGLAGRVLQSGEPVIIDDYFAWAGHSPAFEPVRPHTAVLKVPLKWQGKTIGVLGIDADAQRRTFKLDDVRLAALFANVAALAIGNARLYEELQGRTQRLKYTLEEEVAKRTSELAYRALQLETSAQVGREITSILDIDQLLERVVELIREAFGYYYVEIFMVEAENNRLAFRAGTGALRLEANERRKYLDIGPSSLNGEAAQTNRAIVANTVSENPYFLADELLPDTQSELVVPLRRGERVIGTLDVQSSNPNAFTKEDVLVIQSLGDQIAIAIENARLYDQSRALAVLEERQRLARELHDSVTQSLFSLDLHAKAVSAYLKKDAEQAEAQVREMRRITHDALSEMRSLIYDLRPSALEEYGLVAALRELIGRVRRPGCPEILLDARNERRLSREVEQGLFRIGQEALSNAIKHANARQIQIALDMAECGVRLEVSDDGRGLDPLRLPADCQAFGLTGMRERAALLKATFEISSRPDGGTRILVQMPN